MNEFDAEEARRVLKEIKKTQKANPNYGADLLNEMHTDTIHASLGVNGLSKISPRVLQNLGAARNGFVFRLHGLARNPDGILNSKEMTAAGDFAKNIKTANPNDAGVRKLCSEVILAAKAHHTTGALSIPLGKEAPQPQQVTARLEPK